MAGGSLAPLLERLSAGGIAIALPWGDAEEGRGPNDWPRGIGNAVVLPRVFSGAELAAIVAHADFAVGLDTGLMHLAAAFGVPGVSLFGPTDPTRSGPYGENQLVIQSGHAKAPCFRRRCSDEPDGLCCMRAIEVDRVAEALGLSRPKSSS